MKTNNMRRYHTKLLSHFSNEELKKLNTKSNIINTYKFKFLRHDNKHDFLNIIVVKKIKTSLAGVTIEDNIYIKDGYDKKTFVNIIKHEIVHWIFSKHHSNNKKYSHLYNEEEIACIIEDIYDKYSQMVNYILAFIDGKKKICN